MTSDDWQLFLRWRKMLGQRIGTPGSICTHSIQQSFMEHLPYDRQCATNWGAKMGKPQANVKLILGRPKRSFAFFCKMALVALSCF